MKYDLVIPLRPQESAWENNEIRYLLRSVEKHFPVDKVFVVTDRLPDWLTNVIHIQASDSYLQNKDANIILKVLAAAQHHEISEIFYWSCDDHLFLRRPRSNEFIPFYHANLRNEPTSFFTGTWKTGLLNTMNHLLKAGNTAYNFDCHCPQPIHRDKFIKQFKSFHFEENVRFIINTFHHNSSSWSMLNCEHIGLRKATFEKAMHNLTDIRRLLIDRLYMNYNNEGLTEELRYVISELFQTPSRYEK